MKKLLTFLFFATFLISLVSANGIQINPSEFNINKTQSEEKTINFTLTNTESIDFVNLTVDNSPHIFMEIINNLSAGETISVSAIIDGTSDFFGEIEILAFYEQNLGQPEDIYNLTVEDPEGLSECNMDIIEGDTVVWNNEVNGEIKMVNSETGNEITRIQEDSDYQITFNEPKVLEYHFERIGARFTSFCKINVQASSGLVTSLEYNPIFNLNLHINFPPTTIDLLLLENEYTIQYDKDVEDILKITNDGNETARNIILTSPWISFSNNNLNLNPGESRNIGYTISPQISTTNETNQTYKYNITIQGNFDDINEEISIFVPYATVSGFSDSGETLEEIMRNRFNDVRAYCQEEINRNKDICAVFRDLESPQSSNNTKQDSNAEIARFLALFKDNIDESLEIIKTENANQTLQIDTIILNQDKESSERTKLSKEQDQLRSIIILFIIVIITLVVLSTALYIIIKIKKERLLNQENFYA